MVAKGRGATLLIPHRHRAMAKRINGNTLPAELDRPFRIATVRLPDQTTAACLSFVS